MDERFEFLIGFLTAWAWQALGKVPHPVSGKVEQNLDTARRIIDVLEMIAAKTTGNLAREEDRLLKQALADLKLNYVDEHRRAQHPQDSHGQDDAGSEEKTERPS